MAAFAERIETGWLKDGAHDDTRLVWSEAGVGPSTQLTVDAWIQGLASASPGHCGIHHRLPRHGREAEISQARDRGPAGPSQQQCMLVLVPTWYGYGYSEPLPLCVCIPRFRCSSERDAGGESVLRMVEKKRKDGLQHDQHILYIQKLGRWGNHEREITGPVCRHGRNGFEIHTFRCGIDNPAAWPPNGAGLAGRVTPEVKWLVDRHDRVDRARPRRDRLFRKCQCPYPRRETRAQIHIIHVNCSPSPASPGTAKPRPLRCSARKVGNAAGPLLG